MVRAGATILDPPSWTQRNQSCVEKEEQQNKRIPGPQDHGAAVSAYPVHVEVVLGHKSKCLSNANHCSIWSFLLQQEPIF